MESLQLSQLSIGELERVQRTLEGRYEIGKRSNIVQIGFGIAERRGQPDTRRPGAICFFVQRKSKTQPTKNRIEATLRVRVRRGDRFCELIAPSDVIALKPSELQLTGRSIQYTGFGYATAGILLAWRHPGRARPTWGIVTVGHTFPRNMPLPDTQIHVRVTSPGGESLPGRFVARGDNHRLDAALSVVRRQDLALQGLIPPKSVSSGRPIRSREQLMHDVGETGCTMPRHHRVPLQVMRFLLKAPAFRSRLGFVPVDVLQVLAEDDVFGPGTSGSPWSVDDTAACIQFAAYRPRYRIGFGQSLATILAWARQAIANINDCDPTTVDMRLVRFF